MRGVFLSDLHLFSQRSIGQPRWESIADRVRAADQIVLGGDIFDFRWSRLGSNQATLDAAESWIVAAMHLNERARWSYLLGNHDSDPAFQERLQQIAKRYPNFGWHRTSIQIEDRFFMHGDILDAGLDDQKLDAYRQKFHAHAPRGSLGNFLYRGLLMTRLHRTIPRWRHSPRATSKLLSEYVRRTCPVIDLKHVCFGHTHVAMRGFELDGLTFHNAGAGIRHLEFAPVFW